MLKDRKYFVTLGFFVNIGADMNIMSANFFPMSQNPAGIFGDIMFRPPGWCIY